MMKHVESSEGTIRQVESNEGAQMESWAPPTTDNIFSSSTRVFNDVRLKRFLTSSKFN